ncbi:hypothetical protein TB2_010400 [Malus domestica]
MRRGGGGGGGHASSGNYRNPCLTMHQPWASLLVYGIKRVEGRSWPSPIRGRLWIHAAGKVPDEATIKAMEEFYREIYAVDGITDLKFPEHYPVSRLLGCVEVVGCLRREELASWQMVPEGVRLEALTDMCWLCEQPQKLLVPFEMRGYQGVYNLEKKIYEGAIRGLSPVNSPLPVKFPLPNPQDPFSLKPGSISVHVPVSRTSEVEISSSLTAAIAGARAAATQFSKKVQDAQTSVTTLPLKGQSVEEDTMPSANLNETSNKGALTSNNKEQISPIKHKGVGSHSQPYSGGLRPQPGAPSKLPLCPISFVVDLRRLLLYSVTVAASSFRQTASSSSYSLADTDTNVFTPPSLSDSLSPQPSPPPSPPFSSPPPPSSLPSPPPSRASPPPLSSYKERFITKGSMRLSLRLIEYTETGLSVHA